MKIDGKAPDGAPEHAADAAARKSDGERVAGGWRNTEEVKRAIIQARQAHRTARALEARVSRLERSLTFEQLLAAEDLPVGRRAVLRRLWIAQGVADQPDEDVITWFQRLREV